MKSAWMLMLGLSFLSSACAAQLKSKVGADLDLHVRQSMQSTGANGMAVAVISDGRVVHVGSWGERNAKGDPLTTETVTYGASLTKAVFAYTVADMAEDGLIDLDVPIASYLPRPLTEYPEEDKYANWQDLAGDERWRQLTPRILLNHGSGFANFGFLEPDGKRRSCASQNTMPQPRAGSEACRLITRDLKLAVQFERAAFHPALGEFAIFNAPDGNS